MSFDLELELKLEPTGISALSRGPVVSFSEI
jgi:hypothetical protein